MHFTLTQECPRCAYPNEYAQNDVPLDFVTLPVLELECHRCGYLTGQIQLSIAFQAPKFQPASSSGHAND